MLGGVLTGMRDAAVDRVTALEHPRPERLDRGDLGDRRADRHVDRAADATGGRRVRERLRMVTGAAGNHLGARGVERAELRHRAAQLERTGSLQVLGLEVDLAAATGAEAA